MKELILISILFFLSCENSPFNVEDKSKPSDLVQTLLISYSKANNLESLDKSPIDNSIVNSEKRFLLSRLYLHDANRYELFMHHKNKYLVQNDNGVRKVDYIDLGYNLVGNELQSKRYIFVREKFSISIPDSTFIHHWYKETFTNYNQLPYFMSSSGFIKLNGSSTKQILSFEKDFYFSKPLFITNLTNNSIINSSSDLRIEFTKSLNPNNDMITFYYELNNKEVFLNVRFTKSNSYIVVPNKDLQEFFSAIKKLANLAQYKIKCYVVSSGMIYDYLQVNLQKDNTAQIVPIVEQQISRYEFIIL